MELMFYHHVVSWKLFILQNETNNKKCNWIMISGVEVDEEKSHHATNSRLFRSF